MSGCLHRRQGRQALQQRSVEESFGPLCSTAPFNEHLVPLSLAAKWDFAGTDLRRFICQSWSGFGQTKVVEA
eukprot:6079414-Lingulodinium_polyedra.AAC.1